MHKGKVTALHDRIGFRMPYLAQPVNARFATRECTLHIQTS